MPAGKKKAARAPIGLETCHRLVKQAIESTGGSRVSPATSEEARVALVDFLEKLGARLQLELVKLKKKTLTMAMLEEQVLNKCYGVKAGDLLYTQNKGPGQRGLAIAGVRKVVTKKMAADTRIGATIELALVGIAEAFLRSLAHNAGVIARGAGRITVQKKDFVGARQIQLA